MEDTAKIKLALVGNPNTGKTTLFNSITSSNEHIGNWHGVTVELKEKVTKIRGRELTVADLPGLYSLSAYSYEEEIARDYIYKNDMHIVNICDANNLTRNLYLTLQLMELGHKPLLFLNMANERKKSGKRVDSEKLSQLLNLKVISANANNKTEAKQCLEESFDGDGIYYKKNRENSGESILNSCPYLRDLNIGGVLQIIGENVKNLPFNDTYIAVKILERDEWIISNLRLSQEQKSELENFLLNSDISLIAGKRYQFIKKIVAQCVQEDKKVLYGYSKADKIILNKFLALPVFLLIISLIFFLTFSGIGGLLTDGLNYCLNSYVAKPVLEYISASTNNPWILSFFKDALFGGVGSLISFLPQIVLLFLFLSILEDTGYMSRLAFTLEDYFSKIGLTGKSVFTLLMGFGCSATACLTARNLEDKNGKIKTALLSSYMSCSAKIPIYTVICGAFFLKFQLLIIILLYLLGVVIAIIISIVLERTVLKSGEQSFIMELPPYRLPSFKRIAGIIGNNIKTFVLRVGTMLISFSIIIWILQSCDFSFRLNSENSMLKTIGGFIAPLFAPLGFGNWGAAACLLCGIIAKEVIVSTMGIINNVFDGQNSQTMLAGSLLLSSSALSFSPETAISFLVFSLLYSPCISTVSVFYKEIGFKWTATAVLLQFFTAYICTYAIYKIILCFKYNGAVSGLISSVAFILIIISIIFVTRFFKSDDKCKHCQFSERCNKKNCRKSKTF